jgi:SAM-dependent methyltransferase
MRSSVSAPTIWSSQRLGPDGANGGRRCDARGAAQRFVKGARVQQQDKPASLRSQLDARSLVDVERLEAEVTAMYRHVARGEQAELHFEVGRALAERLGYAPELLDAVPAEACTSFAGVGYHLDLAALEPGEAVLDLGSGSGMDVFCAASLVGAAGRVVGVDFTDEQVGKATRLARADGFSQVEIVSARIEELPFEDATFDAVLSNGVINLSPVKDRVFAEAARVLRPGGRLAISDIATGHAIKERTRRNVELWAACIAGAIPRDDYVQALEAQGLGVERVRTNDYRFSSERAMDACQTYAVESVSLVARRTA